MKLKLPKKVTIDGRQWNIVLSKKHNGGCTTPSKLNIEIGTNEDYGLMNFIHECLESILHYNHLGYRNHHVDSDNGDYIYVCNHNEFEKVCSDLSIVIRDLIKCNLKKG